MTCHSCRHSAWSPFGLHCLLLSKPAMHKCEAFTYEPGTDEHEADYRAQMRSLPAPLAGGETDAERQDAPDGTVPGDQDDRGQVPGGSVGGASLGRSVRAGSNSVVIE